MLTGTAIKAAKAKSKPYKLSDGKGLHLLIDPRGGRYWRFRYRVGGVEKMLSFGTYPDVGLKLARERRNAARRLVAAKTDPSAKRQEEKPAREHTFAAIADEFMELKRKTLSESTWKRDRDQLVKMIGPHLGTRPIAAIEAPDV